MGFSVIAQPLGPLSPHARRAGTRGGADGSGHATGTSSSRSGGTDTPRSHRPARSTVLGFLNAARKGENELAREYLDTRLSGKQAEDLAHELYVVLDARLPARLSQLSDDPEGSRVNPLSPNLEPVGTVSSEGGPVDIVLERVTRKADGAIWLFASKTLTSIPAVYDEIVFEREGRFLPRFVTSTRVGGIRLLEWGAALIGLGVLYLATVLLNRLLTPLLGLIWRRTFREYPDRRRNALPAPARLLLLALLSRWLLSSLPVSLSMRQFWANAASLITIATVTWLLILLTGEFERYIRRRIPPSNTTVAGDLVRLGRRGVDFWSSWAACSPRFATSASTQRPRLPDSASAVLPWPLRRKRHSRM